MPHVSRVALPRAAAVAVRVRRTMRGRPRPSLTLGAYLTPLLQGKRVDCRLVDSNEKSGPHPLSHFALFLPVKKSRFEYVIHYWCICRGTVVESSFTPGWALIKWYYFDGATPVVLGPVGDAWLRAFPTHPLPPAPQVRRAA